MDDPKSKQQMFTLTEVINFVLYVQAHSTSLHLRLKKRTKKVIFWFKKHFFNREKSFSFDTLNKLSIQRIC